ncbi:type VI secretion system lipoprotein TssJ [Pseudomonas shirazica]|uniref:type VI secretion system lipoprotein TssJ n=1 Tax=Pseudomonas TaxID=286 RepID=UPI002552C11D|nr:type VI secretion system lipoprotein TssJ [Pseudomonas sp. M2(2023)]WIV22101.1 type VI secretion system lipoprotein TssJ [Pseudomonas sp. M2(2023)]
MNKPVGLLLACLAISGCTSISKIYQVAMDPSLPVGGPNNEISHLALSLYAADAPAPVSLEPTDSGEQIPLHGHPEQLAANLSATSPVELTDKLSSLAEQLHRNYPASVEGEQAIVGPKAPAALASYATPQTSLPEELDLQPQHQAPSSIVFKVLQLRDDSLLLDATYEQVEEDLDKSLGTTLISVDDYRLTPGQFKFIEHEEINERTRYIAVVARLGDNPKGRWKDAVRIQARGYNHTVHVHFENNAVELRQDSEYRRDK